VCNRSGVISDFVNTAVVSGISTGVNQPVSDSDAATVTVQSPLVGLVAVNDSPTPLGGTTTLTATATPTANVTYAWAFGDGTLGNGQVATHVYPAVGVYTAVVTASNQVSWLTSTTVVTITDVPIAGLAITSSSPTPLGSVTSFTVTITAGTNVTYTWSFGDGSTGSGPLVSHTYPATGTYTVIVTATNSVSVMTATIQVLITEAPSGLTVYLPIIMKDYTSPPPPPPRPDLVVTELFVNSGAGGDYTVQATVRNQSSVPVAFGNNFYVNVYLDPPEPFTPGQLPDPGITPAVRWGVQGSWFGAGQSRVLTANCLVSAGQFVCTWYDGGYSAVPIGGVSPHRFYGWADPYDLNPSDPVVGTVDESDENNNYSALLEMPIAGLGGDVAPQFQPTDSPGPRPTPTNTP
jgi:PKD repeat protein